MASHLELWQKKNANTSWAHINPSWKETNPISKLLQYFPTTLCCHWVFHNPCVPTGGCSPNFCKTIFSRVVLSCSPDSNVLYQSLCSPSADALLSLQMESMSYIAFISLGQTNQDLLSPYDQTILLALYSTWPNFSYFFLKMSDLNISSHHKLVWAYTIIFIRSFRSVPASLHRHHKVRFCFSHCYFTLTIQVNIFFISPPSFYHRTNLI